MSIPALPGNKVKQTLLLENSPKSRDKLESSLALSVLKNEMRGSQGDGKFSEGGPEILEKSVNRSSIFLFERLFTILADCAPINA